jgi:uncharacterized protein YceH (UPF0502 family)
MVSAYRPSRALDAIENRIVGCLLEKELSTPDGYPLSLTVLTAAVNQKSNRHPVLQLPTTEVEAALSRLLREMLVWRVQSARVLRWQHNLDSKWTLDDAGKAILAELLVRGAQTPGELRSRCQRMHAFAELGEVEATLATLAGTQLGLVQELERQPGQKERRWIHLLGKEPTQEEPMPRPASESSPPPASVPEPPPSSGLDAVDRRLATMKETVEHMRGLVDSLAAELESLRREISAANPPEE